MALIAGILAARPINTSGYNDGFANAPAGTAQYPTMLNGLAARPPWHVAGVDYAVGPNGTPTKDPAVSVPAGCTYSNGVITVGQDNVTIDGYNLTLHNGVVIYNISGYANLTITNNIFGGTNYASLPTGVIDSRGAGLTIKYNTIDGGATGGADTQACLIFYAGSGNLILQYNWGKNYPQQIIEILNGLTSLDYRFNLLDDFVETSGGSHMNTCQFSSGTISVSVIDFNTIRQTFTPGAEGMQRYFNNSGTMVSPDLSNNTAFVPIGGQMSNVMHGTGLGTGSTTLVGTGTANQNYFYLVGEGPGGAGTHPNPFYLGSFVGWVGAGNIDMNTGGAITFPP